MSAAQKTNINTSAYRVLYILLLMIRQRGVGLPDINRALHANPLIKRSFNSETLTKYINTLRFLGGNIPRSSSKTRYCYTLASHPFPMPLTPPQNKLALSVLDILHRQPDTQLYEQYRDFLTHMFWANGQELSDIAKLPDTDSKSAPKIINVLETQRRLLARYREFCHDGQMLHVRLNTKYPHKKNADLNELIIEPIRMVQEGKVLYLLALDTASKNNIRLNLNHIAEVSHLPVKARNSGHETTVVYQLYGRLAAGYRLYPGEEVLFKQEETIQLKLRTDNPQALLARLRKYGTSCQVISPHSLRHTLSQQVAAMKAVLEGNRPVYTA